MMTFRPKSRPRLGLSWRWCLLLPLSVVAYTSILLLWVTVQSPLSRQHRPKIRPPKCRKCQQKPIRPPQILHRQRRTPKRRKKLPKRRPKARLPARHPPDAAADRLPDAQRLAAHQHGQRRQETKSLSPPPPAVHPLSSMEKPGELRHTPGIILPCMDRYWSK